MTWCYLSGVGNLFYYLNCKLPCKYVKFKYTSQEVDWFKKITKEIYGDNKNCQKNKSKKPQNPKNLGNVLLSENLEKQVFKDILNCIYICVLSFIAVGGEDQEANRCLIIRDGKTVRWGPFQDTKLFFYGQSI